MMPEKSVNNPSSLLARVLSMDADALSKLCAELREKGEVKGEYYSPELFWSGQDGPGSDVYTLGLALYEEQTGALPFAEPGADAQARADALGRRMKGEAIPEIDGPASEAIAKALSFKAAERQKAPSLLRRDLEAKPAEAPEPEFVPDFSAFDVAEINEIDKIVTNILGLENSMPETASEPAPETTAEPVQEPIPEATAEPVQEPIPETAPEQPVPEAAAKPVPVPKPPRKPVPVSGTSPAQAKKEVKSPRQAEHVKEKRDRPRKALYIVLGIAAVATVIIILLLIRGCEPVPAVADPSPTPAVSAEPTPAPTPGASAEPTPEASLSPTPEASLETTPEASASPSPSPASGQANTSLPASTPATTKTPAATTKPTATPSPTATPTPTPTASPATDAKYEIVLENCSWEQAKLKCEEMGGHLATVSGEDELKEIIALAEEAGAKFIWLGAKRGDDGEFEWVTGEAVDYFVWDANEPSYRDWDGTYENYLMLWKVSFTGTYEWRYNDVRNDPVSYAPNKYWGITAYICQYD